MPKQLEASPSFKKWRKKSLLLLRGFKEAMKGFNVMREGVSYLKLVKQRLMAVCRISIQIGREFQNRKETFPISFYSFWNYTCFVHDFVCFLKTKKDMHTMWYHATYYDPIRPAERSFKSISSETQSLTFFETKSFREILCILKHRRCLTNDVHEMYNLIWSLFAMKIYQRTLEIFYDFVLGCCKKCWKSNFFVALASKSSKIVTNWWQSDDKHEIKYSSWTKLEISIIFAIEEHFLKVSLLCAMHSVSLIFNFWTVADAKSTLKLGG